MASGLGRGVLLPMVLERGDSDSDLIRLDAENISSWFCGSDLELPSQLFPERLLAVVVVVVDLCAVDGRGCSRRFSFPISKVMGLDSVRCTTERMELRTLFANARPERSDDGDPVTEVVFPRVKLSLPKSNADKFRFLDARGCRADAGRPDGQDPLGNAPGVASSGKKSHFFSRK